jgi:hypothetical protein
LDKTIVLNHTNQGKDIGAKLIAIDYLLTAQEDFDVAIFVHDKRSPQSPLGNYWYRELTKIFYGSYADRFKKIMAGNSVGICCAANFIKSEYDTGSGQFKTNNNQLLQYFIKQYDLKNAHPYGFVAGTIFGCKWDPVKTFFMKYAALDIKSTLEKGNVQDIENGTNTHSWERLFSWIITSQGYSIKGL